MTAWRPQFTTSTIVSVVLILFVFNSCELFKKTSTKKSDPINAINLDTVNVTSKDTAPPLIYRASATKLTDIIHTKLEVKFDWTKQYMYGQAIITAKPYFYSESKVMLDARGMEINKVSLLQKNGVKNNLQYKYEDNIISIELDKEYTRKDTFRLFIDYVSKPNEIKTGGSNAIKSDKGLYFINPDGKEPDKPQQIWTQGETQSNCVWFPTIDRSNEKMTDEIAITVDKKYTTLSNGELEFQKENADGTRTDYWKMELPHSAYLMMMAVGEFSIIKDTWHEKEVSYYVEKEFAPYAKNIFGNTPEMIEFFSNKLGVPFAWNKYSQIVVRDYVSGAMENTTATLHGEFLQQTDRERIDGDNEDVISHELFHQWFGDLVTCESWSNLSLNESFATYGEYLWKEYKYGRMDADQHLFEDLETYLNEAEKEPKNLIRFYYKTQEDMFDGHSYQKGGLVLHMLRKYVGDDAYFASLKLYLETNKFQNAEIADLRMAFEKVTGEDLNWFFNQWYLAKGHPDLIITHDYNENLKKYIITIEQKQDLKFFPLFKLPMDVDIYSNGTKERKRITMTKQKEDFEFDVFVRPDLVNVDAEKNIVCTKQEFGKPVKDWIYQLNNASLYKDKYEALVELVRNEKDSLVAEALYNMLNNKYWYLRYVTLPAMDMQIKANREKIKNKLMDMARTDDKSMVRAEAITFLADTAHFKDQRQFKELYKNALKEQSYLVLGEALYAIAKIDSTTAMAEAAKMESEKNKNIESIILNIYSAFGNDNNSDYFLKMEPEFDGYWRISFYSWYGSFLMRCKDDESINKALPVFEKAADDKDADAYTKYFAKRALLDLTDKYTTKEKTEKDPSKLTRIQEQRKKVDAVLEKFKK